jgi:hypothetical protein
LEITKATDEVLGEISMTKWRFTELGNIREPGISLYPKYMETRGLAELGNIDGLLSGATKAINVWIDNSSHGF